MTDKFEALRLPELACVGGKSGWKELLLKLFTTLVACHFSIIVCLSLLL